MRATNNPAFTLVAGTATSKNLLAKLNTSTGVADLCGASDTPVGVTMQDVTGAVPQGIRLLSAGTQEITASGSITKGAAVFTAANGKVSATQAAGARCVGIALDAASDGDIFGVLPIGWANLVATAAYGAITDSTGGTPSTTFAAITAGAGYAQADMVAAKNALSQIAADLNTIRTALVAAGLLV